MKRSVMYTQHLAWSVAVVYEFTDSRFWYGKQSSGSIIKPMNTTLVTQICKEVIFFASVESWLSDLYLGFFPSKKLINFDCFMEKKLKA